SGDNCRLRSQTDFGGQPFLSSATDQNGLPARGLGCLHGTSKGELFFAGDPIHGRSRDRSLLDLLPSPTAGRENCAVQNAGAAATSCGPEAGCATASAFVVRRMFSSRAVFSTWRIGHLLLFVSAAISASAAQSRGILDPRGQLHIPIGV